MLREGTTRKEQKVQFDSKSSFKLVANGLFGEAAPTSKVEAVDDTDLSHEGENVCIYGYHGRTDEYLIVTDINRDRASH